MPDQDKVWTVYQGVVSRKWYASGPFLKQFESFEAAWEWLEMIRHKEPS